MKYLKIGGLAAALVVTLYAVRPRPVAAAGDTGAGNVGLKSAGVLTFGPDGVLFVGDSAGGAVAAIDTGDKTPASAGAKIDVQGLDTKLAAMVGVAPGDILINDVAVNPISKNVYLSISRGKGPA